MEKHIEWIDLLMNRRSCRAFRPDALDRAVLETIVEAGRVAPSAMNVQKNHFYVITNPELLAAVSSAVSKKLKYYADKDCRYGAPVLVLVTNSKENRCAIQDASCAMENMMLAATALGVGSCWINQPYYLNEDAELRVLLGVGEDERMCASLALGLPAKEPRPLDHSGNPVTWVE